MPVYVIKSRQITRSRYSLKINLRGVSWAEGELEELRLFKKSFPEISSKFDCILTFSLGLSVPTWRRFCHLRTTI